MLDTLDFVYQEFKDLVKEIKDEKHLDEIRVKFLGKNGLMTNEAKKLLLYCLSIKKNLVPELIK